MGQYCTAQGNCAVGCTDATDCIAPTTCEASTNECTGCTGDDECVLGAICVSQSCVPGCNPTHDCAAGDTCCGSSCSDLETDLTSCGACGNGCPSPPNATATCVGGMCGIACNTGFADCNGDSTDGCELDVPKNGSCCTPGAMQSCYNGPPSTLGVGECKGGTQTCNPSGLSWGACVGEVLPSVQLCLGKDEDCNGALQPDGCVPCTPGAGSCNGTVGTYCPDGLGEVVEACDPLQGMTCVGGKCVGVCSKASLGASYVGCDYFPTVTANRIKGDTFHFGVAISNTTTSAATVTITQGAAVLQTITVDPQGVQVITLPWVDALKGPSSIYTPVGMPGSVRVNQGAYRLRSTQPVTVYQFNGLEGQVNGEPSYSNDASILLPTTAWTGQYLVASRHTFMGDSGFYAVTAVEDGTTVTVAAPPGGVTVKAGVAGIGTNGAGTVVLSSGDVIEIVSDGLNPNDVSGTRISADKPVQVIGGHQCIQIPEGTMACDHLEESMFPIETLSTSYIVTAPVIPNQTTPKVAIVRVMATKPNTTLTYDPPQPGAPTTIASAGQWVELASSAADYQITGSEPILVVQYMEGQNAGGGAGDPAMTLAVAKDQYRKGYLFHAPPTYASNYVNITAPTGAAVTLDGASVSGFSPIGGSGFSVARVALTNANGGSHTISSSSAFGISVYGYHTYTSYWYPGGSDLTRLHK